MQEATHGFRYARWVVLAFALLLVGGLLTTAAATAGPAQAQAADDDDGAGDDDDGMGDDDDGMADNDDDAAGDDDDGMDDDDGVADNDDDDGGPAPAPGRTAGRLEGPDRITTAIAISQFEFPNGSGVVYLARSDDFADALAGGSLTRRPILLVPSDGLPDSVAAEIRRLDPDQVIALGGVNAISQSILDAAVGA